MFSLSTLWDATRLVTVRIEPEWWLPLDADPVSKHSVSGGVRSSGKVMDVSTSAACVENVPGGETTFSGQVGFGPSFIAYCSSSVGDWHLSRFNPAYVTETASCCGCLECGAFTAM
jgi:hypothetical protein